jgi:hypothetical protein
MHQLTLRGPDVYNLDEKAVEGLGGIQGGVKDSTGADYSTIFRNITSHEHAMVIMQQINTMLIEAGKVPLQSYTYDHYLFSL